MPFGVQADDFLELSKQFGPEGAKFALDTLQASIRAGTKVAGDALLDCVRSKRSPAADGVRVRTDIDVNEQRIVGKILYSKEEKFSGQLKVLAEGKGVAPHTILPRTGKFMVIDLDTKKKAGKENRQFVQTVPGKNIGKRVIVARQVMHPGIKPSRDCSDVALKKGDRFILRRITKASQLLVKRLLR